MINEFGKRILSSFIILPIAFFFIFKGSELFAFFLGIIFFITSYEWLIMNKKNNFIKSIGLIFLLSSFCSAYLLRNEKGFYFFLFIILISILTDLGGYFFGRFFKGPKLTKISPNKTYSGAVGSFLLSLIIIQIYFSYYLSLKDLIFITLIISLISQIGDIFISFIKRKANFKDTGNILPGHGGLLDRFDGLIFAIPTGILLIYILL